MIQILVECDAGEPFAFQHDAVTGVRVALGTRVFQILEGPEAAVMLGVAVLADDAVHLARTHVTRRSFDAWRQEVLQMRELPGDVGQRLTEFAAATEQGAGPDARQAIGFLSGLVDPCQTPAITSGLRPMSKVGGQAGDRAWVVV